MRYTYRIPQQIYDELQKYKDAMEAELRDKVSWQHVLTRLIIAGLKANNPGASYPIIPPPDYEPYPGKE